MVKSAETAEGGGWGGSWKAGRIILKIKTSGVYIHQLLKPRFQTCKKLILNKMQPVE